MSGFDATEQAYRNGYEAGRADAMKWISVKDKPPEVHCLYLDGKKSNAITYWMPLPRPPKEAEA